MEIEEKLKSLKKDYLTLEPPAKLMEYGWLALQRRFETPESKSRSIFGSLLFRSVTLILALTLGLGGVFLGLTAAAQEALPGEKLYPIKRFSEKLILGVISDGQVRVERRAQEMVELVEKDSDQDHLKEAVQEYKKAISETKLELKHDEKEQFRERLKDQERRFIEATKSAPLAKDDIEEAIKASRKGRERGGEVEGVRKDEKKDREDRQDREKGDQKEKDDD